MWVAILEARHLVKKYPGVTAVDDVSFAVEEGICFGLLGPNGAGKTTTVEIIEGVTSATSGEVWYYGAPAGHRFREEAGIQFQNTALQDFLTVRETLEMFRDLYDRQFSIYVDNILGRIALQREAFGKEENIPAQLFEVYDEWAAGLQALKNQAVGAEVE